MADGNPTIIDCVQRDDVWREARRGLVTASRCVDVVTTKKTKGEAAPRRNYRAELIVEILTGITPDRFVTPEMKWGIQQEPYARAAYEFARDIMVEPCGFVIHGENARFGASPDGLIGDDGLLQIKCPITSNHLAWILANEIPVEHGPQLLAELAVTGRQWVDFVSYDPRVPEHMQLFVKRYHRDEKLIAALEAQVLQFLEEIDATIAKLPAASAPEPEPEPVIEPKRAAPRAARPAATLAPSVTVTGARKPHYRDVDPETGKPRFADYDEYETVKDHWLQQDTLRQLLEMLSRGQGAIN